MHDDLANSTNSKQRAEIATALMGEVLETYYFTYLRELYFELKSKPANSLVMEQIEKSVRRIYSIMSEDGELYPFPIFDQLFALFRMRAKSKPTYLS